MQQTFTPYLHTVYQAVMNGPINLFTGTCYDGTEVDTSLVLQFCAIGLLEQYVDSEGILFAKLK